MSIKEIQFEIKENRTTANNYLKDYPEIGRNRTLILWLDFKNAREKGKKNTLQLETFNKKKGLVYTFQNLSDSGSS